MSISTRDTEIHNETLLEVMAFLEKRIIELECALKESE